MTVRIKNTAVELDFWFAAVITFLLLFMGEGSAACFVLCVLHEIGHLIPMLVFGCMPKKIKLGFFGMKIVMGSRLLSPEREAVVALGGPFVNFALAVLLFLLGKKDQATISTGLATFNLLPVPMLDGGSLLEKIGATKRSADIVGFVTCFVLLVLGIIILARSKRNFTVLTVALYLLVGMVTDE